MDSYKIKLDRLPSSFVPQGNLAIVVDIPVRGSGPLRTNLATFRFTCFNPNGSASDSPTSQRVYQAQYGLLREALESDDCVIAGELRSLERYVPATLIDS